MTSAPPSSNQLIEKLKSLGNDAFKRGDMQAALQHYSAAIDTRPKNSALLSILLSNRAQCYLKLSDENISNRMEMLKKAAVDAKRAVAADSSNLKARYRQAQALIKMVESLDEYSRSLDKEVADVIVAGCEAVATAGLTAVVKESEFEALSKRRNQRRLQYELDYMSNKQFENKDQAQHFRQLMGQNMPDFLQQMSNWTGLNCPREFHEPSIVLTFYDPTKVDLQQSFIECCDYARVDEYLDDKLHLPRYPLDMCAYCGKKRKEEVPKLYKCSACHRVKYCGRECQQLHFDERHAEECAALKAAGAATKASPGPE